MMLMGFVMFFVFSVVLSLSPEQLATAQEQNISVLSYLANVHESPLISYMVHWLLSQRSPLATLATS